MKKSLLVESSRVCLSPLCVPLSLCPWWAIYRESKGIIVPWNYRNRLNRICLNLESSLAARLGSASVKLENGRSVDPPDLFWFFPYNWRISPNLLTRFRRVKRLWQSTAKFDLRFDLNWIWSWFWLDLILSGDLIGQRLTIADPQRRCPHRARSGARRRMWRSQKKALQRS